MYAAFAASPAQGLLKPKPSAIRKVAKDAKDVRRDDQVGDGQHKAQDDISRSNFMPVGTNLTV